MGLFERFPSTKLNDINLDWILKKIRALRGGRANQVLAKASNADFDFMWVTGGGGGVTDYDDLDNRPQINSVTLTGDLSASDLGLLDSLALAGYRTANAQDTIDAGKQSKITASGILKGDGDGGVTAATAGTDYLAPGALNDYRTATAQDLLDAAQDANVGIVITGARPALAVNPGQYVIVRSGTITGIVDGLYIAVNALSPGADVEAADLSAVSGGGLNHLRAATAPFVDNQSHIDSLFNVPSGIVNIRIGQLDSNTIGVPSAIAGDLAANPWQLQGGWQSNGYYKGLMYTPWNTPYVSIPVIGTRVLLVWCDISRWEFSTLDGSTVWTS